jgi:hypothetical protein
MSLTLKYTGKVLPFPGELDTNGQPLYPYIPNTKLSEAWS